MKTVLLVRHAKSSWDDINLKDFDRPLNKRGHRDAPEMAKRLRKKNIVIDAFISSPAKRAFTTCKYFAEEYDVKEKKIIKVVRLYEPSVEAFYETISEADETYNAIALFSHNPGISDFANILTDVRIDDMPTCSIYAITANTDDWKNFREADKTFLFFDYPKQTD